MGFTVCGANRSAEQRSRYHPSPRHCICQRTSRCREELARVAERPQTYARAADQVGSTWFARIAIIRALKRRMPRFRRRSWSPEELRLLDKLVVDGASPRTAAEALNRSKETVRTKARRVGCPFPRRDEVKRQRPPAQEEVELPQLAR